MKDLNRLWHERMAGLHNTWEARLLYGEALRLPLEQMVVPLRLRPLRGGEAEELSLASLDSPTVVIGSAGSGKTTWLRHLFRRLLAAGELPLLLDLRELRQIWAAAEGPDRSLDRWLTIRLRELVPEAPEDWFPRLMAESTLPPLTLLLDGWEQLGHLSEEVRGKLVGLCTRHARLRLVLTSRWGGLSLPPDHDGFSTHRLEPLENREIETLARRVLERDGQDPQPFIAALERDPEARELARRPLLLQMMLLLDPVERLPNRLHSLCRSCVEHLLLARGGDLDASVELDEEEQLEALGTLAAGLLEGEELTKRDLAPRLPSGWPRRRREAWLHWLTVSSGLAEVDHKRVVRFVHQSVVDALAAEHLHRTIRDPDDRRLKFHEMAGHPRRSGVLRLWAALVEEQEPGAAGRLAETLEEGGDGGLTLAGALYAEGYGSAQDVQRWLGRFRSLLVARWPAGAEACARSWARSSQRGRQEAFAVLLRAGAAALSWPAWLRVREFGLLAGLFDELERPAVPALSAYVVDAIDGGTFNERVLAASRFLSEGSPLWPGRPWEIALLWLWPSRRPMAGRWLQRLATLGMSRAELAECAASWASEEMERPWKEGVLADWTGDLADDGTFSSAQDYAMRLAKQRTRPGVVGVWAHDLIADMTVVMDEGRRLGRKPAAAALKAALRLRRGLLDAEAFEAELQASADQEPLWLSLARVLAARDAPEDRAVLLAALADVGDHDPALQDQVGHELEWGLRWVVRGDVLLANGRVLTLEELGLELPLLEP